MGVGVGVVTDKTEAIKIEKENLKKKHRNLASKMLSSRTIDNCKNWKVLILPLKC